MLQAVPPAAREGSSSSSHVLRERLFATRALSLQLADPLSDEDMVVQPEDDASPTKWHLAHVTWFFEEFVLSRFLSAYRVFDPQFRFCFNSYYEAIGARQPRAKRGLLSRPSLAEVRAYREHVDAALQDLFDEGPSPEALELIELGINHEQQHQELVLTDILALFAANPLRPAYTSALQRRRGRREGPQWHFFDGGVYRAGSDGAEFSWDNERPAHEVLLMPFALADGLVTNGDWLAFMADDGYRTASLWLADGWSQIARREWSAPRYWEEIDGAWHVTTLQGRHPVDIEAPVQHVSYYEADAYARWMGCRLPTEFEWEIAAGARDDLHGLFGSVWQWTGSAYLPYPGFRPALGAVGEYNGKFMVGQHVLRGSSFATPAGHSRRTYRNFFYPHQRWQISGVRLAKEIG